jgi:hypothetical protein
LQVRGYKTVVRFFSHDVYELRGILEVLEAPQLAQREECTSLDAAVLSRCIRGIR